MNTENQPFERSPEFFVAEAAHHWLTNLPPCENREVCVGKGRKIDPLKGEIHEILEVRVTYQMEKVGHDPVEPLKPLPPIPSIPVAPVDLQATS